VALSFVVRPTEGQAMHSTGPVKVEKARRHRNIRRVCAEAQLIACLKRCSDAPDAAR